MRELGPTAKSFVSACARQMQEIARAQMVESDIDVHKMARQQAMDDTRAVLAAAAAVVAAATSALDSIAKRI